MNENDVAVSPNVMVLSLQTPASLYLGVARWDMTADFKIAGLPVEGDDTPFVALADILVDADRGCFAGLTWPIFDPAYRDPMRQIARRLDPRVVHYNDLSDPDATRSYPTPKGSAHWLEICWSPSKNLTYECAQLCNGQWFWWYETEGDVVAMPPDSRAEDDRPGYFMPGTWGASPPLIALGISHVSDILNDHHLTFPVGLDFPRLDVEAR